MFLLFPQFFLDFVCATCYNSIVSKKMLGGSRLKEKIHDYYIQFKSNRLFKATMKTYFIIACMVFLAYALVMVLNVYHAAVSQLTSAELKMLSQSETTNDFILRDINSAANNVFENETVAIDAMTKPYNTMLSYDISNLISDMKNRTNAIDKVYFFNLKNDCIYTGDNPVYSSASFPDKELLNMIASQKRYSINIPHILKYEDNSQITEERVLLSLYKYSDTSCMAVFLDSDVFNSMVNADFENKNQSMMILQSDGTVISSTDPNQFGQNLSENKIVRKINDSNSQSGSINNFGTIYCYKKSNTLNSLYICSFRSSSVVVSYIWQFTIIILFALLLLFLYFLSSIQMSMSIFRPFKRLRQDVFSILGIKPDELADELGTERDLTLISKNLANIKEEYDHMQETENLYSETKRNELVYKLMTGAYSYNENELEDYNIVLTYPYNTMLLARLDNTKNISPSNVGLIQYGIANAGTELLTHDDMKAYFTTYSDEYDIIFLVNHKSERLDISYLTMLQKYAQNAFGTTISVAYDSSDSSTDSVSQMYRNVKYAMQYRIVQGHNSIICYTDLLSGISSKCEYPDKIEKNIIREINQQNKDGAIAAVNDFIKAISSMPYSYIVVYSSVLALAIAAHIALEKSDERNDIISDEILRTETIDELRDMLISKCSDAIISVSRIEISDKHVLIANTIEEYINDHYTDPNLSIDLIASYVNKSANYTRNIFKQNKNISISEYISHKRFDEVKRMLIETNLTAQTIAQKVGMNSGSYFYTAFKKYTGYTPDQYRKKYMSVLKG